MTVRSAYKSQKVLFTDNPYIIFYILSDASEHINTDRAFHHEQFSDLPLWRYHSWPITLHERKVLLLWRHNRRLLLHGQIGTKFIFTGD